jgi:hypothetical protein
MKKLIYIPLTYVAFFSYAYAGNHDKPNQCSHLHIQISNQTSFPCTLSSRDLIHGNLDTPPPLSILSGDSKQFDLEDSAIYGPNIKLTYQCGSETISIKSQQNFCGLMAGNITGTLLQPQPKSITASYTAITGSHFWGKPGSINWSITNR